MDKFTESSIPIKFKAFWLSSFGLVKGGLRSKHYASDEEVKTTEMKWLKEQ